MTTMLALLAVQAGAWPQTRAERTGYQETSHYEDVVAFLDGLKAKGAPITIKRTGKTTKGRDQLLVIASRPRLVSPESAREAGKLIVHIQANIHAGEVEGKEAILHLLRKWCQEKNGVLDKAVLLINPIYNIDGNEEFAPQSRNRPGQNGPELVGQRANGQGLDLNRDYIKAESPEMQAALKSVWNPWRPHVFMDLHTTDGTRHGYPLTWSPPLNPNTDKDIYLYARDSLMPKVKAKLESQGLRTFDYGNDETVAGRRAWYSVAPDGRYSTNAAGLRNCIGVLSEALVYLPFKERVEATEKFVTAVVDQALKDSAKIQAMQRAADRNWTIRTRKELGVRFDFASRGTEPVWLEKKSASPKRGVPKDLEQVKLPVLDRFVATRSVRLPLAYVVPGSARKVIELLRLQGVRTRTVAKSESVKGAVAFVTTFHQDAQPFQKHKLIRLDVERRQTDVLLDPGDVVVPCDNRDAALVHCILDPESTDGAVTWGFFGEKFPVGSAVPVRMLFQYEGVSR
ncbi:MAG: M14 family metallopeptidase [Armatimonadetes bacterium]|nr:M14 family metallopeptidase [Armatimonadota bacterium]